MPEPTLLDYAAPAADREQSAIGTAHSPAADRDASARWGRVRAGIVLVDVLAGTASALLLTHANAAADALPAIVFAVAALLLLAPRRTFHKSLMVGALDSCTRAATGCAVATMASISAGAALGTAQPNALGLRLWLITAGLLCLTYMALGAVERLSRKHGLLTVPTLIVGAGVVGTRVARRLLENPTIGLRPLGFLDADPLSDQFDPERDVPVLGAPSEAVEIAALTGARHVIFAFSWEKDHEIAEIVRACQSAGLEVATIPRLYESVNGTVTLDYIGGLPLMGLHPVLSRGWRWSAKYTVDRIFAGCAVLFLGPLLLAIAAAVRLSSPGPAIYRQRRVGRGGREFDLLKFRSMRLDPRPDAFDPGSGIAPGGVEGVDRRTRIGRWLRDSSLDELPQLLNVLRGEMSLVGPRPERPEFVQRFSREIPRYGERHRVKPGITGWAQVNGLRGQTSIEDRVEWDNHYIENWSLHLELRTIMQTIGAVLFFSEDAQQDGGADVVEPVRVERDEEPFLLVDARLTVRSASRRARELLGVDEPEISGRPVTELLVDAVAELEQADHFVGALRKATISELPECTAIVRPRGAFGVRSRARISHAPAPSATRIVLEEISVAGAAPKPRASPGRAESDQPATGRSEPERVNTQARSAT